MTQRKSHIPEDQLQAYLDGTMPASGQAEFEERLAEDMDASQQVELSRQVDEAMRRVFAPPETTPEVIDQLLSGADRPLTVSRPVSPTSTRRRILLMATIAAVVAWVLVALQSNRKSRLEPYFEQRPLVSIYQEIVENGFRPYYFCEDEVRFAATFKKRQKVPLRLADLPAARKMIGLSYLGGLSRDTTAILCTVDGRPVVVFVDRIHADAPVVRASNGHPVNVVRKELGALVLYEVTPFPSAMILDYLESDSDAVDAQSPDATKNKK